MKYKNILEEEIKNKIAQDYFWLYDCTKIIGKVDFCVSMIESSDDKNEQTSLLWAEAKNGSSDVCKSIVQLVLTIGKARTFDKYLPPPFLGAFDAEKIAFIAYNEIQDIFYMNDFNWNIPPSNYETKEFKLVYNKVKKALDKIATIFYFTKEDKELKSFIKNNFIIGKFGITKTNIDKNNFLIIYNKWFQTVKPSIAVDWEILKKYGIIDVDFYLADLLSINNKSIKESLDVVLKHNYYELDKKIQAGGLFTSSTTGFKDNQKAHIQFWNKYERPPHKDYWEYIVLRRDLLVPQDVRERKGSYFTPQIWVELSQQYLADVLGESWQDEYYIWDCAAGTGNLLNGLTNKYNIWASTLDKQDVDVMKDRIKNGANLLEEHVFQFDFLNDDFKKLPNKLQQIINDPEKRKKLVMYINPPYAETNAKKGVSSGEKIGKIGVNNTIQKDKYKLFLGKGSREIYAQFLARIYNEINSCKIAIFSKIKILNAPFYEIFRNNFLAKLEKIFLVPSNTFDNVNGQFPISFQIWDTNIKNKFSKINAKVFDKNGVKKKNKFIYSFKKNKFINEWIIASRNKNKKNILGKIFCVGSDFQHQNYCRINSPQIKNQAGFTIVNITENNLIICCIYYAVRHCIKATWLNDRDQFLYPNNDWQNDIEFQNNCLTYTLFNNHIHSKFGINDWIPFTEYQVGAKEKFESNFMTDFIAGKLLSNELSDDLFSENLNIHRTTALQFSKEAKAVFNCGQKLWQYYHQQPNCNVNASLYEIKEFFQGRNKQGRMHNTSKDEKYNNVLKDLKDAIELLAQKIEPNVYEFGFLLK